MPKFQKIIIPSLIAVLVAISTEAQQSSQTPSTNFMTSDGKIYVVVAVVVTIVTGLFIYLYRLDRKISRLEKNK